MKRKTRPERVKLLGLEKEVADHYANGKSLRKTAATFGVDRDTVRNFLANNGVQINPMDRASEKYQQLVADLGQNAVDQMMVEAYKTGQSTLMISKEFGLGEPRVWERIRRHTKMRSLKEAWENNPLIGPDNPNYKGSGTEEYNFRRRKAYREWRLAVFTRDNYTCVKCGATREGGAVLHADHIKSFIEYPELRLAVENGQTVCQTCDRKSESYGKKRKN